MQIGDRVKVVKSKSTYVDQFVGQVGTIKGKSMSFNWSVRLDGHTDGDSFYTFELEVIPEPLDPEWVAKIVSVEGGSEVLQALGVLPKPKIEKHGIQVQFHLTWAHEPSSPALEDVATSIKNAIAYRGWTAEYLRGPVTATPYTYHEEA